jgi:hydroxymethylglutaryl-CoA lyase
MKAAYESNCFRFDSALGGIGGCPMAQNDLVGNLATEEVISFFEKNNIDLKLNKEALFDASRMESKIFI